MAVGGKVQSKIEAVLLSFKGKESGNAIRSASHHRGLGLI